MATRRQKERRKVSARKVAENKKSGFVSTLYRVPEGMQLFNLTQNECIKRMDILDYVTGDLNPASDEPGMLHYELSYTCHRGLGADEKGMYVCPKVAKKKCPVCEYRSQLLKEGKPWDDDVVKALRPKDRQLFLLYDLDDLDKGLQLWDFSYHLFGKMLNDRIKASDEDEGYEFFSSHDESGLTLKIAFDEKSLGGNKFAEASSIDFKPRKSAYPEDLIDKMPCLDDLLIIESYDKLHAILFEGEVDEAEENDTVDLTEELDDDLEDEIAEEEEEDEPPKKTKEKVKVAVDEDDEDEPDWDEDSWDD